MELGRRKLLEAHDFRLLTHDSSRRDPEMMLLLAFAAFFALVLLWLAAPTGAPECANDGAISSSPLAGADAAATA
ncbi:MAG: hypothetical protein AVDCRST_MAG59-3622 [uncultured Thermomicrobiales bacterium]|uniref:Uncharacterized protein n=1 Tax=uncultured Thermomicrobiales bacterium TaxID=1645740 RepID=A0A6J4V8S7_9BACT|nr:MAG: hypothetical protein AVDCRST_MAG59-3622 [uncultured Thermomicrobiales bacterium]